MFLRRSSGDDAECWGEEKHLIIGLPVSQSHKSFRDPKVLIEHVCLLKGKQRLEKFNVFAKMFFLVKNNAVPLDVIPLEDVKISCSLISGVSINSREILIQWRLNSLLYLPTFLVVNLFNAHNPTLRNSFLVLCFMILSLSLSGHAHMQASLRS